jgi:tagatose-6-phosphate ketose/aldose isomerase
MDRTESQLRVSAKELLGAPVEEQRRRGYYHTLSEIFQQPATWRDTCQRMLAAGGDLHRLMDGVASLTLTGSGSSLYAGECARLALRQELGITVDATGAGALLTHGSAALPAERPAVLVSLARSGDSPESGAAIAQLLESELRIRHVVITCNQAGHLSSTYTGDPRVHVILLDDRTNDRSLAMTSSVTNMWLAARFLGMSSTPERYRRLSEQLARTAEYLLDNASAPLSQTAGTSFRRAVFLGSGSRFGAARESSLKMLELTNGRVTTLCESYLGVRHGPLTYIHDDTLVVCFYSSDPLLRAYESDLITELNRKQLGMAKLILGENVPPGLAREGDTVIECPGLAEIGDENATAIDLVAGQLLACFRSIAEGFRPDLPSDSGVINRVVEPFKVHQPCKQGTA